MKIKAAIFDFNGTLFWDTQLHNEAWDIFLKRHNIHLSDDDKLRILHGKNNELIIEELFGEKLTLGEATELFLEKESIYQKMCMDQKLDFAPGVISLLDFLKAKRFPFTIATASGIENIEFYFDYLDLGRWFKRSMISFNDGNTKSKPDPEIFNKAIRKLNIESGETLIFEDSVTGIQAAENAGAGRVIIVNSTGFDYSSFSHDVIKDFNEVDRNIFD